MDGLNDIEVSVKNRQKAIDSIPAKLKAKEDRLLSIFMASKKSPLSKLADLYDFMSELSASFLKLTPCKRGCSYCCYIRVDVSDLEMEFIRKYAKKSFRNIPKGHQIGDPCPFLKNGACSVYEARPFQCRRHQVFTPTNKLCAPGLDIGEKLLTFTEVDKSYLHIVGRYSSIKTKDIREYFSDEKSAR